MNTNFVNIIKRIVSEQDERILGDPPRLKGFIADYAAAESKSERLAFGRCIEAGAYNELKNAPDAAARQAVKAALAHRVHSSEGLDITLCNNALDVLEAALYEAKPLCQKCGKELQPEWKSCPFCGAAVEAAVQEIGTSPEEWGTPVAPVAPPPVAEAAPQYTPPPQQAQYTQYTQYSQPYQPAVPAAKKNPLQYFFGAFKKYAVFEGRARRAEFWWFSLFNYICVFMCGFIEGLLGIYIIEDGSFFQLLYSLVCLLPSLALTVRRMHDCNKSGWYLLIPIYGWIVLPCTAGTIGPNRFGPDPKQS